MQENEYIAEPESVESVAEIAAAEGETKSIKRANPLRKKAQAFIRFYTELGKPYYGVGAECAILAGYSKKAAASVASEILSRANVKAEIEKIELERARASDWDFERWQAEIVKIFDALPSTNPQKLRAVELIGKAKGFIKDNQIQLNTLNIINDQDMTKIREAVAADVGKRLYDNSARQICEKALTNNHNQSGCVGGSDAPQPVVV